MYMYVYIIALVGSPSTPPHMWVSGSRPYCPDQKDGTRHIVLMPSLMQEITWYGTPLGAKATAHAARTYLSCLQPDQLMLKIDFRNAFNTVKRDVMLPAVLQHTPEIHPLVFASYRNPTHLYFGNNVLESPKVCSRETLLVLSCSCSLTIHHHLLIHLTSELKVFYLDDGTLGGTADEIV